MYPHPLVHSLHSCQGLRIDQAEVRAWHSVQIYPLRQVCAVRDEKQRQSVSPGTPVWVVDISDACSESQLLCNSHPGHTTLKMLKTPELYTTLAINEYKLYHNETRAEFFHLQIVETSLQGVRRGENIHSPGHLQSPCELCRRKAVPAHIVAPAQQVLPASQLSLLWQFHAQEGLLFLCRWTWILSANFFVVKPI